MQNVGIWQINQDKPQRLTRSEISLEKHLENWIADDPGLLQAGLTIVGRQVRLSAGRLDLLALDLVGNWVVIEIKKGTVRWDTVSQAIYYAASIETLPFQELASSVDAYLRASGLSLNSLLKQRGIEKYEERQVNVFVVGTRRDPDLERMADYLAKRGIEINVVTFEVFQSATGEHFLVRELTELDTQKQVSVRIDDDPSKKLAVEDLYKVAQEKGAGETFIALLDAAQKFGFYPRLYTHSVMYTPPNNRSRVLFTVWVKPNELPRSKLRGIG